MTPLPCSVQGCARKRYRDAALCDAHVQALVDRVMAPKPR